MERVITSDQEVQPIPIVQILPARPSATFSADDKRIDPPRDWLDDPLVALNRPPGPYTYEKAEFYLDTEPVELYNGWLVIDEMPNLDDKVFEGGVQGHMIGAAHLSKFGKILPDQMECHLSDGSVIKPDLSLISHKRLQEWAQPKGPNNRPCLIGCPELIIEVRSSSNSRPKDKAKRTRYFENGAEIIWDVDQKAQVIYVYRIDSQEEPETFKVGDEIDCEPLLPGWRREVADLFNDDIPLEVMFSEVIEVSRKKGEEIGREEGRQEGELLGKQELLIRLLQSRFTDVSESILDTIRMTKNLSQLDSWFNQALVANSLDELLF